MIAAFSYFSTLEDNNLFDAGLCGLHIDEENNNNIIYWMGDERLRTEPESSTLVEGPQTRGENPAKRRNEY